jgi:hypothetical protein
VFVSLISCWPNEIELENSKNLLQGVCDFIGTTFSFNLIRTTETALTYIREVSSSKLDRRPAIRTEMYIFSELLSFHIYIYIISINHPVTSHIDLHVEALLVLKGVTTMFRTSGNLGFRVRWSSVLCFFKRSFPKRSKVSLSCLLTIIYHICISLQEHEGWNRLLYCVSKPKQCCCYLYNSNCLMYMLTAANREKLYLL